MSFLAPGVTMEPIRDLDPFRLKLDFLFPEARIDALEAARSWLRPDWHRRSGAAYLARLARAGVRPEEVDVVFCTHLHADHVGWNTRLEDGRWVPTFPRARYLVGKAELAHWLAEELRAPGAAGHGVFADSVQPILDAGLFETVEDGADLGAGLDLEPGLVTCHDLPGHSPGQMGVRLSGRQGSALFCGDAVHSPLQLHQPDWCTRFCHDAAQARRTRHALLSDLAESGDLLVPAHLRDHRALRVRRAGAAYVPDWFD